MNVFDDGPAAGLHSIRDLVREYHESRLRYWENPIRFGPTRNDAQVLKRINPDNWAILLPSDLCLAPTMVEVLLTHATQAGVSVARSGGLSYEYAILADGKSLAHEAAFREHPRRSQTGLVDAKDIIAEYFGPKNLKGELFDFSLLGSLFHGALTQNFYGDYLRFPYHGFEQYLALSLLLGAREVLLLDDPLIYDIVGAPRIGSARPADGSSRADCLLAAEEFLSQHELELLSMGMDIFELRSGQVHKANYYLAHYAALQPQVRKLRQRNLDLIEGDLRHSVWPDPL